MVDKAKFGQKHICPNCGIKFYDMNRSPVVCPNCGYNLDEPQVEESEESFDLDEDMPIEEEELLEVDEIEETIGGVEEVTPEVADDELEGFDDE